MKRASIAMFAVALALLLSASKCEGSRPLPPEPTKIHPGPTPSTQEFQGNAPAEPVAGAFCSVNDLYKERNDKQGRKFRCGPDKNGNARWQLIPD